MAHKLTCETCKNKKCIGKCRFVRTAQVCPPRTTPLHVLRAA